METKANLVSGVSAWNAKRIYKVNSLATHSGSTWQNTTGKNSEPGIGSDWKNSNLGSTPTPYRKVFTFSGGAQTFTLDSGVVAKSVFLNKAVLYNDSTSIQEWSQAGDIVTINDSLNTLEIDDQIYILN